ncbi:hypothetical protein S40293_08555 [Stachybotrys chartarum IBT 40293]|nr:hypothetical protein S40293_08555 [Stachybotrys chartarum IBT 40293]
MPGSQLKRLKASLREQGITGPQQSKKQKRKLAQDDKARSDKRLKRSTVLDGIREQFNPFDLKHASKPKFEVTTNRSATGNAAKGILGRPSQSKAISEERRRDTLLVDMQRRNKVGGILDRRFGEDDPTMTPEEKMLERFAREKQRSHKNSSMFDLEEDEPMEELTHLGKSLEFGDKALVDDFQEDDLEEYDSDGSVRERQRLNRIQAIANGDIGGEQMEQPDRKKTKKEVMEEVMAKSKMHKYERQAAKEEDTDLREELDKELSTIQALLSTGRNGGKRRNEEGADASTIAGVDRDAFERKFDLEIKKLAQDKRAQPSDRTKTEEEKAEEESERLKELEEKRQRRMRGEEVTDSEDDDEEDAKQTSGKTQGQLPDQEDDEDDFGLGHGIRNKATAAELGFEDEDDFVIDDDLVASGSDIESFDSDVESVEEAPEEEESEEEDEFTKGLLNEEEARNPIFDTDATTKALAHQKSDEHGLPFTFPCPQSYPELQAIMAQYPPKNLPTIIQRIRALYHPKLDSKNKERLGNFSVALVDLIAAPWDATTSLPFSVVENVIRHIHSLAKMFPLEIAIRFRHHLETIGESRPLALEPADLVLLTAAGSIFPTSDHFHQVITPAMLTITRYLGQKVPHELDEHATGVYLSILSLQYQQLAKRYVPEVLNFCSNTLFALSPVAPPSTLGDFPLHASPAYNRVGKASSKSIRRLTLGDCLPVAEDRGDKAEDVKIAILSTTILTLDAAADTWSGKEAFLETFKPTLDLLKHLGGPNCRPRLPKEFCERTDKLQSKLERMLRLSQLSRRPLELHHHKPLAIKTYIPKFEETFDPDKHYDPDRERAALAKLKAEHKKERKGAMRELRKDANFMAREKLRLKKAKDEAYEKKYKRLVAEIQSEEGKEANAYEREKASRKRAKER